MSETAELVEAAASAAQRRWFVATADDVIEVSGPAEPDWDTSRDDAGNVISSHTHFAHPALAWTSVLNRADALLAVAVTIANEAKETLQHARATLHHHADTKVRARERYLQAYRSAAATGAPGAG